MRTGGAVNETLIITSLLPPWLIGRLRKYEETYARCDLAIREALISSLHFVVAVVLITGGIILVVVIAAFFTVNIAQESSSAVAAAHRWSVMERNRSLLQEGAMLQQAVEAGTAAWEDAVEKHWPAALAWTQAHVEDVFPGANATELWISAQHIYAQVREAMGRVLQKHLYRTQTSPSTVFSSLHLAPRARGHRCFVFAKFCIICLYHKSQSIME